METTETVTLRPIRRQDGYHACVELQRTTWGEAFTELVPASLLMVSHKIGGLLAGAFGDRDDLLGFVFGLAGERDGLRIHWSHMLAVRPDARGRGLGRRLKLYQRERLLERGVDVALWTYDPLVSRNAHLNLNRLGARVTEYEQDLYGTNTNSPLHGGGTDRFIVRWELRNDRVRRALEGQPPVAVADYAEAPAITLESAGRPEVDHGDAGSSRSHGSVVDPPFPLTPRVLVEIPGDIQALKRADPSLARRWRRLTRAVLPWYLERGYTVQGLLPGPRDDRYRYALEKLDGPARDA